MSIKPLALLPAILIFTVLFLAPISYSSITSAVIASDTTGAAVSLYYDTSSKNYLDGTSSNPNIKMRIYYSGTMDIPDGYYAGFAYNVNGSYHVFTTTTNGNFGLDPLGAQQGSPGNYHRDTTSALDTPGLYPGYVYAVISSDSSPSAGDQFILVSQSNGWLRGSMTPSFASSSYNQGTGQVTLNGFSSIMGTSTTGGSSIIANNQHIAVGVCSDTVGTSCSSSALTTRTGSVSLQTGVTAEAAKASPQSLYLVYNGFSTQFSIGNDLSCTSPSYNPSGTVYDGDNLTISTTATNAGNVDISAPFDITFYKDSISPGNIIATVPVSTEMAPGAGAAYGITINTSDWNLSNSDNSPTTFWVSCDSGNALTEISKSNNLASSSKTVNKVVYMAIYINGNMTNTFPAVGVPYNVSVNMYDSAGGNHAGDIIRFSEYGGVSAFAPLQVWVASDGNYSLMPTNTAQAIINSSGWVTVALMPTGPNYQSSFPLALRTRLNISYSMKAEAYTSSNVFLKSINLNASSTNYPSASDTSVVNKASVITNADYLVTLYNFVVNWLT